MAKSVTILGPFPPSDFNDSTATTAVATAEAPYFEKLDLQFL